MQELEFNCTNSRWVVATGKISQFVGKKKEGGIGGDERDHADKIVHFPRRSSKVVHFHGTKITRLSHDTGVKVSVSGLSFPVARRPLSSFSWNNFQIVKDVKSDRLIRATDKRGSYTSKRVPCSLRGRPLLLYCRRTGRTCISYVCTMSRWCVQIALELNTTRLRFTIFCLTSHHDCQRQKDETCEEDIKRIKLWKRYNEMKEA